MPDVPPSSQGRASNFLLVYSMSDVDKEKDTSKARLTPAEWAIIEEMWASGAVTLDQLAEQFLCNPTFLSRELSKRGVKKGVKSKELAAAATERVRETLIDVHAEKIKRIADTKSEHYTFAQTLAKLTYQIVANAIKERRQLSSVRDDIRTLKDAITTIAIARDERFRVLGLDKDQDLGDEVPTLIVREMTGAEITAIRGRHEVEMGLDVSDAELKDFVEKIEEAADEGLDAEEGEHVSR